MIFKVLSNPNYSMTIQYFFKITASAFAKVKKQHISPLSNTQMSLLLGAKTRSSLIITSIFT